MNARHLTCARAQDGCIGLPMDPAVAHLWLVEPASSIPPKQLWPSTPGSIASNAGAVPFGAYPAHAKGADLDECAPDQRAQ